MATCREPTADRNFWQLRNSGYIGPIDQDGNAVTDPTILDVFNALAAISK